MNNTFQTTRYYSQGYHNRDTGRIEVPAYKAHHFEQVKHIIKKVVEDYFKMTNGWMEVDTRLTKYRLPRQWCHFWALQFKGATLHKVAEYYGKKDHATALHSRNSINNALFILPSGTASDEISQRDFRKMKGLIDREMMKLKPSAMRYRRWRSEMRNHLQLKRALRYLKQLQP